MDRYIVATTLLRVPWSKTPSAWYLVIERTTNVSRDWVIRLGTDDKQVAERECLRLNRDGEGMEVSPGLVRHLPSEQEIA